MTRTAFPLVLAACLLAPALPAQTGLTNSLALHWTHTHNSPIWYLENVPSTESLFGYVDNLLNISWLAYTSPAVTLPPGRYGAKVRLKKYDGLVGPEPLNVSAMVDGVSHLVMLPASDQPIGQWVETPPLLFNVTPATPPITFTFGNTDTSTKATYLFDSFTIQAVPTASSLATDWVHVHGAPYWTDDVPSSESIFGVVDNLNSAGLTWLQYYTPTPLALPPGTYSAKVRFQKILTPLGTSNLTLTAIVGATPTSATRLAVDQPVDQWVETPPVTFTIPTLADTVTFDFGNYPAGVKRNYLFDRVEIMPVSTKLVGLLPDRQATIGATVTLDIFAPASPGLAAGCAFSLTTSPVILLGDGRYAPIAYDLLTVLSLDPLNGVFTNMFPVIGADGIAAPKPTVIIPNLPVLAGITVFGTAVTVDPSAPAGIGGISTAMPFQFVP